MSGGAAWSVQLALHEYSSNKCRPFDVLGRGEGCPTDVVDVECEAKMEACSANAHSESSTECTVLFVDACRHRLAAMCNGELRTFGADDPPLTFGPSVQPSKTVAQRKAEASATYDTSVSCPLLEEATKHADAEVWLGLSDCLRRANNRSSYEAAVRAAQVGSAEARERAYMIFGRSDYSFIADGTWRARESSDATCHEKVWWRATSKDELCVCWSKAEARDSCPAECLKGKLCEVVFFDGCHRRVGTVCPVELTQTPGK